MGERSSSGMPSQAACHSSGTSLCCGSRPVGPGKTTLNRVSKPSAVLRSTQRRAPEGDAHEGRAEPLDGVDADLGDEGGGDGGRLGGLVLVMRWLRC